MGRGAVAVSVVDECVTTAAAGARGGALRASGAVSLRRREGLGGHIWPVAWPLLAGTRRSPSITATGHIWPVLIDLLAFVVATCGRFVLGDAGDLEGASPGDHELLLLDERFDPAPDRALRRLQLDRERGLTRTAPAGRRPVRPAPVGDGEQHGTFHQRDAAHVPAYVVGGLATHDRARRQTGRLRSRPSRRCWWGGPGRGRPARLRGSSQAAPAVRLCVASQASTSAQR